MRAARVAPVLLIALLLALGLAACGGDDDDGGGGGAATETDGGGSSADGAAVFASAGCGGCHTLDAAGSTGAIGPNLDQLMPDKDTVARQVRNGGGGMPSFAGDLSDEEIDAVAEYVSSSAGG